MDYLFEYLLFLAQAVTIVAAILLVIAAVASLSMRRQQGDSGHLEIIRLNDRLKDLRDGVRQAVLPPAEFKRILKKDNKAEKKAQKQLAKSSARSGGGSEAGPEERKRRVFVLDFRGDLQASRVKLLRTEVTAVLTLAEAPDEVLIRLESPGGSVHGYGLAASQLDRFKQHGVPLIASVDKVAASGGYLMAAVADRILAAPFAVIGSIGVVAQIPNVHRLLKKHDVDVDILTAGKYKRTLTVLGENTEEGRQKFVEELEDLHSLFQEFVGSRRPALDIEQVATGEAWYGKRALDLKLVDEICTSDEYLAKACMDADVFEVHWVEQKKPIERLLAQAESSLTSLLEQARGVWHR
ncbi:MAG: protease SohB [Pseudomonadales bacterium]|nr:protease SohB [Pseudomonadales bacterium]